MSTTIFIIAHAPLASALKNCAMHVYSYDERTGDRIVACDVPADADSEETASCIRTQLEQCAKPVLIFTDIVGATPSNIAQSLATEQTPVIPGVNLPMILTALCHQDEPIESLVEMVRRAGLVGICPETA